MDIRANAIITATAILLCAAGAKAQQNNNYHIYGSGQELIQTHYNGHNYTLALSGDTTTSFCVDNRKVAPGDMPKYDSLIKRIIAQVRADEKQGELDRAQGDRDREQGERDRLQGERDRAQGEIDRQQGERDRLQGERDREQGDRDRAQGELDRQQGERDREQGARDREQGERDRKQAEEDRRMMRELIDLLVQKKLIPARGSLKTLVLTDDELVINGQKASDEAHKEFKQKYQQWAHQGLSYGRCGDCCTNVHFSGSILVD